MLMIHTCVFFIYGTPPLARKILDHTGYREFMITVRFYLCHTRLNGRSRMITIPFLNYFFFSSFVRGYHISSRSTYFISFSENYIFENISSEIGILLRIYSAKCITEMFKNLRYRYKIFYYTSQS